MNQVDYKKKYDEALERAKELVSKENVEAAEYIFPELAESEDERIGKDIIAYMRYERKSTKEEIENRFIPWLEKQGNTDLEFFENSENEKREFVGYGFLKCKGDFLSFKEGENYWLEYVGKDNYNVRSDNLLGQTFHITPQQLYTVFRPTTWLEKQGESYTKKDIDDAWLKGICDAKRELEKQGETSPIHSNSSNIGKDEQAHAWSEEDERIRREIIGLIKEIKAQPLKRLEDWDGYLHWLKSLKDRVHPNEAMQKLGING